MRTIDANLLMEEIQKETAKSSGQMAVGLLVAQSLIANAPTVVAENAITEPTGDLISREALKKEFARYGEKAKFTQGAVQRIIDNAPTEEEKPTVAVFPDDEPLSVVFDHQEIIKATEQPTCYTCKYCAALITDKDAPCRKCIDDAIHNKGCWTCWEAKQEGWRMIKLEKCPFCDGEAIFNITSTFTKVREQGFGFKIKCTRCGIVCPDEGKVSVTLDESGTLRYIEDNRLELATKWNTRKDGENNDKTDSI